MQLNLHTVAVRCSCDDNQNLKFYVKKISLLNVWKKIIESCDIAHTRLFVFYLTRTNIRFDIIKEYKAAKMKKSSQETGRLFVYH